jgi:putative transposase
MVALESSVLLPNRFRIAVRPPGLLFPRSHVVPRSSIALHPAVARRAAHAVLPAKLRHVRLRRPRFEKITPAHVTLRIADDIPSLRSSRRFRLIKACFMQARVRPGLRLVEFSVLSNHLHLIVEADSSRELSRRVQGLCVRLARALNEALDRSGRVFSDHFHSEILKSPTQLVNAIRYVLGNAERHYGEEGTDAFSSEVTGAAEVLARPEGWLLRLGWLRAPARLLSRLRRIPRYRWP